MFFTVANVFWSIIGVFLLRVSNGWLSAPAQVIDWKDDLYCIDGIGGGAGGGGGGRGAVSPLLADKGGGANGINPPVSQT